MNLTIFIYLAICPFILKNLNKLESTLFFF